MLLKTFMNQFSALEVLIKEAGRERIFLPKFHCKFDPIEMASLVFTLFTSN